MTEAVGDAGRDIGKLTRYLVPVLSVGVGLTVAHSMPLAVAVVVASFAAAIILLRPNVGLGVLLFLGGLPLGFLTGGDRSVFAGLGGTTVSGLLLVLYVALLFIVLAARGWLFEGLLKFLAPMGFVLWSTLTLSYTVWPDEGIRLVLKIWYVLLVGVLAYQVIQGPNGLRVVTRAWYLGYAAVSFVALARLFTEGLNVYAGGEVYRYSALQHPSPFSFFMLVTAVFAYCLWKRDRGRLHLVVASTASLQVLLSQVRISIAALVLAMVLIEVLMEPSARRVIIASAAAAATVVVMLMVLLAVPELQEGVFYQPVSSAGELAQFSENLNVQGRDSVWAAVLDDYRRGDTLIGRGAGSSTLSFREGLIPGHAGVMHNEYLRVLYEQGLAGLVWFGALLFFSLAYLFRLLRRSTGTQRPLVVGALVGLIVYMVIAVTDNPFDYYNVFGQYVAVLAAAALAQSAAYAPGAARQRREA